MSYSKIPAGKDLPNDIYVAIEIPANHAPIKYEIDKDSDCLFVDRFMATPMFYPANYGFIPNTLADDGDPLDVLVVTPYPVAPGSVIRARPVGILHMTDDGGGDAKVSYGKQEQSNNKFKDQDTIKEFGVGYDYHLSKRTDVYAYAGRERVKSLTSYQIGLAHKF